MQHSVDLAARQTATQKIGETIIDWASESQHQSRLFQLLKSDDQQYKKYLRHLTYSRLCVFGTILFYLLSVICLTVYIFHNPQGFHFEKWVLSSTGNLIFASTTFALLISLIPLAVVSVACAFSLDKHHKKITGSSRRFSDREKEVSHMKPLDEKYFRDAITHKKARETFISVYAKMQLIQEDYTQEPCSRDQVRKLQDYLQKASQFELLSIADQQQLFQDMHDLDREMGSQENDVNESLLLQQTS